MSHSNPTQLGVLVWNDEQRAWHPTPEAFPEGALIVDLEGRDGGLRFVDLNRDGHNDIVFSNERRYAVYRYDSKLMGWGRPIRSGLRRDVDAVPMIVRNGANNGAWFANGRMWIQNEDTDRLPDGVERVSFDTLLGE